jgi:chromosome segregation ATPase
MFDVSKISQLQARRDSLADELAGVSQAIRAELASAEAQIAAIRKSIAPAEREGDRVYKLSAETRSRMSEAAKQRQARIREAAAYASKVA